MSLLEVMTWPTLESAQAFCVAGAASVSKRARMAEFGASFVGAMSLTVGDGQEWVVQLGEDRAVTPPGDGEVLCVLASRVVQRPRTRAWGVEARVVGRIRIGADDAPFTPIE